MKDPTAEYFCRGHRGWISNHALVGVLPESVKHPEGVGPVRIGDDVTIREFCAIQRGTGERETTIGDRCYLMDRVHVAHDCLLGDDVIVSPSVVFGGHTRVHRGATVGIGAMTHQHVTIGAYAMIGMGAVVLGDVPPFATVAGNPARCIGVNYRAIERALGDNPDMSIKGIYDFAFDLFLADSGRGGRSTIKSTYPVGAMLEAHARELEPKHTYEEKGDHHGKKDEEQR